MLREHVQKEGDMGTLKLAATAVAVILLGGLGGCATPGDQASVAARHQHLRDAKHGPAASTVPVTTQAAIKPLHDHREMK